MQVRYVGQTINTFSWRWTAQSGAWNKPEGWWQQPNALSRHYAVFHWTLYKLPVCSGVSMQSGADAKVWMCAISNNL